MNVVFLISRRLHEMKVDRHRPSLAAALTRRDDCRVITTGHGWPGYDSGRTVSQNLANMGLSPDVLWVYQTAADHIHEGVRSVEAVRCLLIYDAYETKKRKAEVEAVEPQVIVHTHANDAKRLAKIAPRARRVHVPFGVDKATFYRPDYGERPIDCLVVGQTDPDTYPLRARWRRLVESGAIPGEVRRMPSYRLEPAQCVRQYVEWGEHMRRAKIVLTGGSKYRYALQVYYAAAMCGCVVVADMPDDLVYRETLGVHQVAVDAGAIHDSLANTVKRLLRDDLAIRQRGLAARNTCLELYTTDIVAERFVEECSDNG